MEPQDEPDEAVRPQPVIVAENLGVDGEHGPLFSGIDLLLGPGFHAVQMPAGPEQNALLLTLSGRLRPSRGRVTVMGATSPARIRKHCAIAAFEGIDDLDESVTVETVLAEQRRWLAPWYSPVPIQAGRDELIQVFGEAHVPAPRTHIVELSDLDLFLLRITLALLSARPILVVGDLEQVRDDPGRAIAARRLGAVAEFYTVVVGVTNPLGDEAPGHTLHDRRILTGKD
ncbi:hypothetical protein P0W64_17985 [Tsukamurella sp. 8F]|uniref:hypothetical protein n=1 Tax=unclassified Tsukamurella TaxID=2633480 RepID=UPI0023BA1754|nr:MULTISPECIES: hypothetical protein [unclassified Tsukamurella]MDF0529869.1 hypothetical protein [Tsukamurella sp. 8J]MDF0588676.1 hypothetical protein [Tsukamurella sp. 8F]